MTPPIAALVLSSLTVGWLVTDWAIAARNAPPAPSTCIAASMPLGAIGVGDGSLVAETQNLTLDGANRVLEAAIAMARARNAGGAIAVVDAGGSLIAFQRLDGTFAAGSNVSIGKARTAAMFKKPTKVFEDAINTGRVALTGVSEMTPLQGGIPIMHEGHVVGGIGVSGAHSQVEDEEIAIAGAAVISAASNPSTTR